MNKRNIFISLLLLFSVVFVFAFQSSDDLKILYEKAKYTMETKGDLQEALTIFEQIVGNTNADRSLRAKAQLHIGICKEKLGLKEAIDAYQDVVNLYPEQIGEVTAANQRIVEISKSLEKITHKPNFRKIQIPTKPGNGVLSPDGKKMAFVMDGSVWVIPVSGEVDPYIAGEPKKLTEDIGAWDMNSTLAWSGDGKWIAFNAKVEGANNQSEVYIISSAGGNPKKIPIPARHCGWPEEFRVSLSPDGKTLAYASGKNTGDKESELIKIYMIPVEGGKVRSLTGPWTQEPAFSPDGDKIAYVRNYSGKDGSRFSDVWVIPAAGGTPVQVTNIDSGQVRGPVWSLDGTMIAFHRRPEGENPKEIWIVPVSESGKATASLQKIDLPLEAFHEISGWTPDNKIGLQLMNEQYEVIYTVPSVGGIATQITRQGWASYPKWNLAGDKIYFRWARGEIGSVPASGGEVTTIPINSESHIYEAVPGGSNDISPDGKMIVFSGAKNIIKDGKRSYEVQIFSIPIEGGEPTQLTTSPGQDRFPCWSPDGKSIAFIRYAEPQKENDTYIMHICIISAEGGEVKQMTTETDMVFWAPIDWSLDGKSITYFSDDNTINSLTVDGGESKVITKVDKANVHFELAWSPDGEQLAYTDEGKIWVIAREGEQPREVHTGLDDAVGATKLSWSPDGKKIAFTAYTGGEHELWLMEDFLPLVNGTKASR
jgi:Tol biopolymer transport system component